MIQRIQTLFLLLAGGFMGSAFLFSFAKSSVAEDGIYSDLVLNVFDHVGMIVLVALTILLSIISIFSFKNRKLQVNLNLLGSLCSIALFGLAYGIYHSKDISSTLSIGIGIPIGSLLMFILANYFIKKDDKLVKSMDRLR